jgi:hypothetical protein
MARIVFAWPLSEFVRNRIFLVRRPEWPLPVSIVDVCNSLDGGKLQGTKAPVGNHITGSVVKAAAAAEFDEPAPVSRFDRDLPGDRIALCRWSSQDKYLDPETKRLGEAASRVPLETTSPQEIIKSANKRDASYQVDMQTHVQRGLRRL